LILRDHYIPQRLRDKIATCRAEVSCSLNQNIYVLVLLLQKPPFAHVTAVVRFLQVANLTSAGTNSTNEKTAAQPRIPQRQVAVNRNKLRISRKLWRLASGSKKSECFSSLTPATVVRSSYRPVRSIRRTPGPPRLNVSIAARCVYVIEFK
jgi:hypothetical protein